MQIKDLLESWKSILTFVVAIVTATWAIIAWAETEKLVIQIEQQLIHNQMYQESRIARKHDRIRELNDTYRRIILFKGDDELTLREEKELQSIEDEIKHLEEEIEEIEEKLHG